MIIQKIKNTALYKLIKTSEAVFMLGLPVLFYFLGELTLTAGIIIVAAYLLINLLKYATKPLYVLYNDAKTEIEQVIERYKK